MEDVWKENGAVGAVAAVEDCGEPAKTSPHEIIGWFKIERAHESLDFEHAETPEHAFVRKLRPRERTAYMKRLKERKA